MADKPASKPAAVGNPGESSGKELEAGGYDAVLQRFVVEGGVRYTALAADAQARVQLEGFVRSAATMSERAPLASWLNVYNALVIDGVLQRLPLDSVMADKGFFKRQAHRVAGSLRSLDEIENGVIRPRFRDARIHMALNCGAISCPALHPRAFRQASLDARLDALSRAAVNGGRHVVVRDTGVAVSSIFKWFAEDFEGNAGSTRAWLLRYAQGDLKRALDRGVPLVEQEYDWKLNQAP